MDSKINIRSHRSDDIKVLLEMTSEDGWSISEIDCMASLTADPKGLLVAEDSTGMPIGFIGLFSMLSDMVYINAFIVRKDLRGKGIGKELWEAMLKATLDKVLVLDSVSQMKDWYKTQGFSYEAYRGKYYKGTISFNESMSLQSQYSIVPFSDDLWSAVTTYDQQVFPYPRENYLREWCCGAGRYSVVARLGKNVVGYANYHWKVESEYNIRALYADNDGIAELLIHTLLKNIPSGSVVSFLLFEGKSLPAYFSAFKSVRPPIYRLFTKEIRGIQKDKIIFTMAHAI